MTDKENRVIKGERWDLKKKNYIDSIFDRDLGTYIHCETRNACVTNFVWIIYTLLDANFF